MSKTLTTRQDELAANRTLRAVPLIKLTTYTDRLAKTGAASLYFSDRTLYYDYGNTGTQQEFQAALSSIGDLTTEMPHLANGADSAAILFRDLTFDLYNVVIDGTPLYETLRLLNLESALVEVGQLLLTDADSDHVSDLVGDEHIVFFRGEVQRVFDVSVTITFACSSVRPQILGGLIADDVTSVDPRDLGKRIPTVYGQAKLVPGIAWQVGWLTTVANDGIAETGATAFWVTDATGFPANPTEFDLIINGEEFVCTIQLDNKLNIVSRAQNGTIATAHAPGETVLEISVGVVFVFAEHESSAFNALYINNPYNQELVRVAGGASDILPTSVFSTANTTLVSGFTLSTVIISTAQLSTMMQALALQAAVTQQPVIGHAVEISSLMKATSGTASLRDGSLTTFNTGNSGQVTFETVDGTITRQVLRYYIRNVENTDTFRATLNGSVIGTVPGASSFTPDWFEFSTTNTFEATVEYGVIGSGNPALAEVSEIEKIVTFDQADPTLDTNAAIEGASVGFGLQGWADIDGVEVPNSDYIAASGALIEHPADIARHMIEARAGEDIEEAAWDESATLAMTLVDTEIGDSLETMLGRVAFESRSQIVTAELAAGTRYRRLAANNPSSATYDYTLPAGAPVIDDFGDGIEDGRDLTTIFTRWVGHYAMHRPTALGAFSGVGDDIDPFRAIERADPDTMDLAGLTTSSADGWEASFGRRDHLGFFFVTLDETATVDNVLAFYVVEAVRAAATARLRGVPWVDAYGIELGDIIEANLDWWSAKRKVRTIGVTKRWGDEMVDLIVVEVN